MDATQHNKIRDILANISLPFWSGSVAAWCADNIRFNEPKLSGPFSFVGREYLREPLDAWSDEVTTDMVMCFGTRTGKTRVIFGGLGWKIKNSPTRAIWVMPNSHGAGGAQNVSRTRFQPMLRATPTTAPLIPKGARRHEFKTLQMCINGTIVDLTGAHSPANLAGNPCDTVIQDEVDKFKRRGESEADPSQLADQRCKEFSTPKRIKASTPTLVSGKIWQELLKTDIRRRFMPCPHCKRLVVFAWSEQFTLLPKTGCEAYISWDSSARGDDGEWDLDEVVRTAHAVCPHCKGKIRDEHKVAMDAKGEWRATQKAAPGYRGWHLPSMYSVSKETGFGQMAKRFLLAKRSLNGLQDFINSDLAEPYQMQDVAAKRIQAVSKKLRSETEDGWIKQLTVDVQQRAPYFWYVVRAWKNGDSEGVEAGSLDEWDEVEAKQIQHGIENIFEMTDSGFGARRDADVYRNCAKRSEEISEGRPEHLPPLLVGWIPAKGFEGDKFWTDRDTKQIVPINMREVDPYLGTVDQGKFAIGLMEFNSDKFRDVLHTLRSGGVCNWAVSEKAATETYSKHLDAYHRREVTNKKTGVTRVQWVKRSATWPDHLLDCEIMQCVLATFHGLLNLGTPTNNEETK